MNAAPALATPAPRAAPWAARLAVLMVYMVFGALLNSVGSVNLLAVQTLGVSIAEASLLDAYKDLPIALVSIGVASQLPRWGLKRAMVLALAAVAVACALVWQAPGFGAIKALFVTVGAAFAIIKVGSYSLVGLLTEGGKAHNRLMNTMEGLFMVGVLLGYLLFGALVDETGAEPRAWTRVYGLMALAAAAACLLLARCRIDESAARDQTGPGSAGVLADARAMFALLSGLVAVFVLCAFLYVLIEQGVSTWLPSFNNDILRMPASMSVWFAVIMPAGTALGRFGSALLLSRLSWHVLLYLCLLAIAALIVLTVSLPAVAPGQPVISSWLHAPLAAYTMPLIGLFLAPIYPAVNSVMLSALPKAKHAPMTGLIVLFSALGGSTGSFITGRVFMHFDGRTAFALLLVPLAALAVSIAVFKRLAQHQARR